jgi:hypothetical protein
LYASPVNDPLTPAVAAFVGVGDALSVAVLFDEVFEFVVSEFVFVFVFAFEEVELLVDLEVVAALFFAVVAFLVVTAALFEFALVDALAGACVVALCKLPEVAAEAPARVATASLPNCGGVTDKTAPRPPTVPPAINNARFMPSLSPYPSN